MLGSLARKLRALGLGATYYRSGDDEGIVRLASKEGGIVLTADRSLYGQANALGVSCYLLRGRNDAQRVSEIVEASKAAGDQLRVGASLCSVCGGELESVQKEQMTDLVPQQVLSRHRLFFRCSACGKVYWRGSHWKKLRSLARRLETT